MKNGFSIGPWTHCSPSKKGNRIEVVQNLCIGPLETYIVGIENGKYFSEYHIIEGLDAGETYYINFAFANLDVMGDLTFYIINLNNDIIFNE